MLPSEKTYEVKMCFYNKQHIEIYQLLVKEYKSSSIIYTLAIGKLHDQNEELLQKY